jgi:hypothetical protein
MAIFRFRDRFSGDLAERDLDLEDYLDENVDQMDASRLTRGTIPAARLSGAYTGITGLGTVSGLLTIAASSEAIRMGGTNPHITFWNAAITARVGYLQGVNGSDMRLVAEAGTLLCAADTFAVRDGALSANRLVVNANGTQISTGYLEVVAASDGNGNLRFSAANPYIKASDYIIMPGGLYVSGGVLYVQGTCNVRGQIGSDAGNFLVAGGSTGVTAWASAGFGSTTTTSGYQALYWDTTFGSVRRFTSTRSIKENIATLTATGSIIDALRPVSFVAKASGEESDAERAWRLADIQHGFIAEEVAEVDEGRWAVWEPDDEGGIRPVMWRQHDMIALLVAEVKSLRARVSALEPA